MEKDIKKAMRVLSEAILSDDGYAIGWKANIACAVMDSIKVFDDSFDKEVAHDIGNDAAIRFIRNAFNVDVSKI